MWETIAVLEETVGRGGPMVVEQRDERGGELFGRNPERLATTTILDRAGHERDGERAGRT